MSLSVPCEKQEHSIAPCVLSVQLRSAGRVTGTRENVTLQTIKKINAGATLFSNDFHKHKKAILLTAFYFKGEELFIYVNNYINSKSKLPFYEFSYNYQFH